MKLPYYDDKYISARDLHKLLKIKSYYPDWILRVVNRLDLVKGQDYFQIEKYTGGRPRMNHLLTPKAAKGVILTERTGLGKTLREELLNEL